MKEMRWIVDEFLTAGLGKTSLEAAPSESYFREMKKQQRWYADTLELGLGLSDTQKEEMKKNLREAALRAKDKLDEEMAAVKTFEVDGKSYKITPASELHALTDPSVWLMDDAYRPWNLCALDDEQLNGTSARLQK